MAKVFVGMKTRGQMITHINRWMGQQFLKIKGPGAGPLEIETLTFHSSIGKPEDANQNTIMKKFMESDCTHLLCIDDDIFLDNNLIDRFLKYDKDIVGGSVLILGEKGVTTCAAWETYDEKTDTFQYDTVNIMPPNGNHLQKCDFVGFGVVMIKRNVLEKMPIPWYETIYNDKGYVKIPPDNYFCQKARKLGFEVYVDGEKLLGQYCSINLTQCLNGYPHFVGPKEDPQDNSTPGMREE